MSNLGWCYFKDEAGTRDMMKNFTWSILEYLIFFLNGVARWVLLYSNKRKKINPLDFSGFCCKAKTKDVL